MLVIGGLFWWEPVLIRLLPLVLHVTVLSGPKPGAAAKPELWMIVEQEMSRAREGWGQTCEEKRGHDPTIFSKHSQTGQQPPKSGHCKSWGAWSSSRRSGCSTVARVVQSWPQDVDPCTQQWVLGALPWQWEAWLLFAQLSDEEGKKEPWALGRKVARSKVWREREWQEWKAVCVRHVVVREGRTTPIKGRRFKSCVSSGPIAHQAVAPPFFVLLANLVKSANPALRKTSVSSVHPSLVSLRAGTN